MTREEAAALLGVDPTAGAHDVRRAWRVWARIAHPDSGGDVEHFRRLTRARDVLLADTELDPNPVLAPAPRVDWRLVLVAPSPGRLLWCLVFLGTALASALLTGVLDPWAAALILGLTSAATAVVVERSVLARGADVGHRIALLAAVWAPIAVGQIAVTEMVGASVLTVLPVMALPFVTAVAMVNPGAGLWRPGAPLRHWR